MIVLFAIIQSYGIFYFLGVLDSVRGLNQESNFRIKLIIAALYLYNPFTLTITWWSIQGWTLFYTLGPFLLGFYIEVSLLKRELFLKYIFFLGLLIFLSPGINGAFAVTFSYSIFFFILLLAYNTWRTGLFGRFDREFLRRLLILLSPGLLIILPIFLPYLIIPLNGQIAPGYVNTGNLLSSFYYQSHTTSLLNVLSLTAFNWLYNAPQTYPWLFLKPAIIDSSYIFVAILVFGIFFLKGNAMLRVLYVFIIVPIVFSVGYNFPFQIINLFLIKLGGPFYVITNAYYILGELYVVSLMGIFYLILNTFKNAVGVNHPCLRTWPKLFEINKVRKGRLLKIVLLSLILSILIVSAIPFVTNGVYQHNTNYSTELKVPSDFQQVNSFFENNYSGPIYNVLVLPLSSNGVIYMDVNGTKWQDNGQFLASYIPYPLIQDNNSVSAYILETLFSSGHFENYSLIFHALHIKYVLVNPYYVHTDPAMSHNSQGGVINYSFLFNNFNREFGDPVKVGLFKIYTINDTSPVINVVRNPMTISSDKALSFYELIGSIKNISARSAYILSNILITKNTIPYSSQVNYFKVEANNSLSVPDGYFSYALLANGTLLNLSKNSFNNELYVKVSNNSSNYGTERVLNSISGGKVGFSSISFFIDIPIVKPTYFNDYTISVSPSGNFYLKDLNIASSNVYVVISYPDELGLWNLHGGTVEYKTSSVFSTLFLTNGIGKVISLDYGVYFDSGVMILVVEIVVLTIIFLLKTIMRNYEDTDHC